MPMPPVHMYIFQVAVCVCHLSDDFEEQWQRDGGDDQKMLIRVLCVYDGYIVCV